MKTIQFTGDIKHVEAIRKFHKNTWNNTDTLRETETRVYVVETDDERYEPVMDDEEFMQLAEESGRVYSLQGFQDAFNSEEVNTAIDYIRFINVPFFGEKFKRKLL